jgi:hypothetical protein
MQLGLGVRGLTLRFGLAMAAALALASCGGSTPPEGGRLAPTPVAVIPATATLYSDSPTTFVVTGGSGNYLVTSSDQFVIAAGTFSGETFTVVPNPVSADTPVTLTVRDTGGQGTQATVQVIVKPRTVSATVSITPSSGQPASCGTAVCSGGDAEVVGTLVQGGAPLAGRQARFEVVSGDFRIITSSAGMPETLATSFVTVTDSAGRARVRIRANSGAESQTALIQITDVTSGSFTRAGFSIVPAANAVLNEQPNTIQFRGLEETTCASGISAEVIVFGGRPPYVVSQPGVFIVNPTRLTSSGDRFIVTATGQCSPGTQIAVVDSAGSTVPVNVTNAEGPEDAALNLVVGPTTLNLDNNCSATISAFVVGGLGPPYFAMSASNYLSVSNPIVSNTITIRRADTMTRPAPTQTAIPVSITDGREVVTITVNVRNAPCDPDVF